MIYKFFIACGKNQHNHEESGSGLEQSGFAWDCQESLGIKAYHQNERCCHVEPGQTDVNISNVQSSYSKYSFSVIQKTALKDIMVILQKLLWYLKYSRKSSNFTFNNINSRKPSKRTIKFATFLWQSLNHKHFIKSNSTPQSSRFLSTTQIERMGWSTFFIDLCCIMKML